MRRAIILAGLLLAACAQEEAKAPPPPAAPVETPEALVRRLYGLEHPPATVADVQGIFTADFTPGMAPATGASPVDWDYRFDERTAHPTDVAFTASPRSPVTTRVRVTFRNHGVEDAMIYDVCKRADGQWRIRDIIDPDQGGGSLRSTYHIDIARPGVCVAPAAG